MVIATQGQGSVRNDYELNWLDYLKLIQLSCVQGYVPLNLKLTVWSFDTYRNFLALNYLSIKETS